MISKGAPKDKADERTESTIKQLGRQNVEKALAAENQWASLLSYAKSKPFRLLDAEWLKQHHQQNQSKQQTDPLWEQGFDPWKKQHPTIDLAPALFEVRPNDWQDAADNKLAAVHVIKTGSSGIMIASYDQVQVHLEKQSAVL